MISLAPLDYGVIVIYFVLTVAVGLGLWRSRGGAEDYLLAGRTVTLPAFVATLVATWYGGILGVGEYSYSYGLALWVVMGLPYYVFALVFALFLAERVREAELYTIPDRLALHYGRGAAVAGSLLVFVLVSPAPYALMLGVLGQMMTGWPLHVCLVAGMALSTFYVAFGGFRTDVRVNILQFVLMFLGFGILLPACAARYGGLDFLRASLPPSHLSPTGGNSAQTILVWYLIALWTLVDPGFHQRCYAARSPKVARNGILVSIAFWALFDFLTTSTGLYARAALPALQDPKMSYPALAEAVLPAGLKGMFIVGMLATVMSTVLSYTFLGAVTAGRDIVWRLRGEVGDERVTLYTRWGLAATAVLAVMMALGLPSVVALWFTVGSICVPGLLWPLLATYFVPRRLAPGFGVAALVGGPAVSALWFAGGREANWLGLEPMIPGLLFSLAAVIAGLVTGRKPSVSI